MAKSKVSLDMVVAAIESGQYIGFCLNCGAEVDGVEPDAEKYQCEDCNRRTVYGAEQILLMGACQ